MRPAAYLIDERVRDMNRNGVLASMCFPSMPGFSGRRFQEANDTDLALIMLKAYNDWHLEEWCGAHPGRFMPLAIGPTWDMDALAAEIKRMAAKGCRAISMPELPYIQGLPSYQSDYWDPFFRTVSDEGVVVCLHIGMGLDAINMGPDFSPDNYMVLATQVTVLAVQDLLWGPAFRKFPDLKVAFSEGGIGWIPFLLDRVDRHYVTQRWTRQDFGDKLAEPGVPRALARVLHLRSHHAEARARDRHRPHRLRIRLPPLRLALARRPRVAPRAVRAGGPVGRRHREDQLAQRRALLRLRPVRGRPTRAGHRRRAPGPGHRRRHLGRVTTRVASPVRGQPDVPTGRT